MHLEWTAPTQDLQEPQLFMQSVSWRGALGYH